MSRLNEIVVLLRKGTPREEVSAALGITKKTLETTLGNGYKKYGVKGFTALCAALDESVGTGDPSLEAPARECVCCGKTNGLYMVEPIGGFRAVPFCGDCKRRLQQTRLEAYKRHSLDVAGAVVRNRGGHMSVGNITSTIVDNCIHFGS